MGDFLFLNYTGNQGKEGKKLKKQNIHTPRCKCKRLCAQNGTSFLSIHRLDVLFDILLSQ